VNHSTSLLQQTVFYLGIAAIVSLLYTMSAIYFFQPEIFFDQSAMSFQVKLIILAILLILVFNILSLSWLIIQVNRRKSEKLVMTILLIMGSICMFLLIGEKVMIDEIGREMRLGWETRGEWIILYSFFLFQLFYIVIFLIKKMS